jgi:hypothetical protein
MIGVLTALSSQLAGGRFDDFFAFFFFLAFVTLQLLKITTLISGKHSSVGQALPKESSSFDALIPRAMSLQKGWWNFLAT